MKVKTKLAKNLTEADIVIGIQEGSTFNLGMATLPDPLKVTKKPTGDTGLYRYRNLRTQDEGTAFAHSSKVRVIETY